MRVSSFISVPSNLRNIFMENIRVFIEKKESLVLKLTFIVLSFWIKVEFNKLKIK